MTLRIKPVAHWRTVNAKVIVFEALRTSAMTRKPKGQQDEQGRLISNKAKQKFGLNKSILSVGWHHIEAYTNYKAFHAGKVVFRIPAPRTTQECALCDHTHRIMFLTF